MAQQAFSYRFSAKYLCLVQDSTHEWEAYIKKLNLASCRLSNEEDSLTWEANPQTGNVSLKLHIKLFFNLASTMYINGGTSYFGNGGFP